MKQAAAPASLVLAGALVLVLWGGTTAGVAVAMTLIGVACVIAVALVFYAVGRSEDRERAAAGPPTRDADREEEAQPPPQDPHGGEAARRARPRPPRRPS